MSPLDLALKKLDKAHNKIMEAISQHDIPIRGSISYSTPMPNLEFNSLDGGIDRAMIGPSPKASGPATVIP